MHDEQTRLDQPRGIKRAVTARKVGSDVALARRCAPSLGSRLLGFAHAVVEKMPHTHDALAAGVIGKPEAMLIVRETACLSREDRGVVDAAAADQLGTVSRRQLEAAAQAAAYEADPAAIVSRHAKAENERRVSLRPAPDCMTWLSALLPVKDGVACYTALSGVANAAATPDHPRGQVMAGTLVERVTGRARADGPDVQVNLIMPLDTLTGDTPAHVPDYGPVPADLAREWVRRADTQEGRGRLRVRRLFSYPGSGDLIGMESRARAYPGLLAQLIAFRDQVCRTPFCGAPIRHIDHIQSHAEGGPTSERNAEGLCERCNYTKEHPDREVTGDATAVITCTAGLTAVSHPPRPPGQPPPTKSSHERRFIDLIWPLER